MRNGVQKLARFSSPIRNALARTELSCGSRGEKACIILMDSAIRTETSCELRRNCLHDFYFGEGREGEGGREGGREAVCVCGGAGVCTLLSAVLSCLVPFCSVLSLVLSPFLLPVFRLLSFVSCLASSPCLLVVSRLVVSSLVVSFCVACVCVRCLSCESLDRAARRMNDNARIRR